MDKRNANRHKESPRLPWRDDDCEPGTLRFDKVLTTMFRLARLRTLPDEMLDAMTRTEKMIEKLPKAELHVHIEATLTPEKAREIGKRNGIELPDEIFTKDGKKYRWNSDGTPGGNLMGFVNTYDTAAGVLKTAQDYTDVAYDYLKRSAGEDVIYVEFLVYADPKDIVGIDYPEMIDAIAEGIEKARADFGIEARILPTFVRHFGPEAAKKAARKVADYPHELVTGLNLAGAETSYTAADFAEAYDIADSGKHARKLGRSAHAGEAVGPESIRDVRDHIKPSRYGHLVRVMDDLELLEEIKGENGVPEVCISSNDCLKIFATLSDHPVREMWNAGLPVTLATDDPTFFNTTLAKEYLIAHREFGFTLEDLKQVTRNAVDAAFVDDVTRVKLHKKLDDFDKGMQNGPDVASGTDPGL